MRKKLDKNHMFYLVPKFKYNNLMNATLYIWIGPLNRPQKIIIKYTIFWGETIKREKHTFISYINDKKNHMNYIIIYFIILKLYLK